MPEDSRVKGKRIAIDYDDTLAFFEERGTRQYTSALSSTMYQDNEPQLVEQRDLREKESIAPLLGLDSIDSVLDIGCGIGRWGWLIGEHAPQASYLGIDFSPALVDKARAEAINRGHPQLRFQTMSATDIRPAELTLAPPYDLVLISGLLIYLNDADCLSLLHAAARLCAPGGRIYLREPVGVDARFTLNRFYSNELAHEYSAIYRTIDELNTMLEEALAGVEFETVNADFLFPETLEKRVETRQYFMVMQRRG